MQKIEKVIVRGILVVCVAAATGLAQVTPDAANVLAGVGQAYTSMSTLEAEGTMQIEMHGSGMEQKMEAPVALTLGSPNEMRVETSSAGMKFLLVLNRSTLWAYIPLMNIYMKLDLPPGAQTKDAQTKDYCLYAKYGNIASRAEEARIVRNESLPVNGQAADCWVVEIRYKPSQNSPGSGSSKVKLPVKVQSNEGELWVEKTHHWVLRDSTDSQTAMSGITMETRDSMTFNKVTMNQPVAPSLFTFTPPSGAKELDLSKLITGLQGAEK